MFSHALSHLRIERWVVWLPCREPVDVAVVHAEGRSNQDCVVNVEIGRASSFGFIDQLLRHMLAVGLNLFGNGEQGLQPGRDWCRAEVGANGLQDRFIAIVQIGCRRAMTGVTEVAVFRDETKEAISSRSAEVKPG